MQFLSRQDPQGLKCWGPLVPEEVSPKPEEASGSGPRVLSTYFTKSSLRIPDQRAQRNTLTGVGVTQRRKQATP